MFVSLSARIWTESAVEIRARIASLFSIRLAFSWIRLRIRLEFRLCSRDLAMMSDQEPAYCPHARFLIVISPSFLTIDRACERIDAGCSWIPQSPSQSRPSFLQRWSLTLYASGCLLKNWYCNTGRKGENIVVLCGPSPFLERYSVRDKSCGKTKRGTVSNDRKREFAKRCLILLEKALS